MASKIAISQFVCATLLLIQNSFARSVVPKCDYACKEQDLDTSDGYFASGSAISSQFLAPDGSVVTNSKETSISSDGIKQTFHELKKEADRFVQTGQGGPIVHPHLPTFGNIPNIVPPLSKFPVHVPYVSSGHDSYSQSATKDHELEQKLIYKLSPSPSSYHSQLQTQNSAHVHSNPQIPCDICASHAGSGHAENTASFSTIVGNVAPASEAHSSYQKYESSAHKNSTYQTQPILFANSVKPANTFTTTYIDLNAANRNINNGAGSDSHVIYHQGQGSSQTKSEERLVNGGPVAYPSRVVVGVVNEPSVVNSHTFEKQQSSTHQVQNAANRPDQPAVVVLQQPAEINNAYLSPVLLGDVPRPGVHIVQNPSSYQSSNSYYSSSSSSSSKSVSSSDNSSPIVIHQSPPQKYSASNGYSSSSSSSSSSSNGGSYLQQNVPEVYYNHGNKVSASIYDHQVRGDQIQSNPNAETLCTVCSYGPAGSPAVKTYGVSTSFASKSSTIDGKTTENREAAVVVDDNGKVDKYHVKT